MRLKNIYVFMPLLFLALMACNHTGPTLIKEPGEPDSVYYRHCRLTDTSDTALLSVLYSQLSKRKDGRLAGVFAIHDRPTTRLEPYPNDTCLAYIQKRFYYSDKGLKKQLVLLKLEYTEPDHTWFSDYHLVFLNRRAFYLTIESVWHDQFYKKDYIDFALRKGQENRLALDVYDEHDSIINTYDLYGDSLVSKRENYMPRIKGRLAQPPVFP